jgi:hypothetical protein
MMPGMKHAGMLFVLLIAACGDDAAAVIPDALVVPIDAPAPDAAPTCAAPMKMCGNSCLAVATDEANCGDCGIECKGGEACDGTCACAPAFIPATVTPGGFDMFQGMGGAQIAIGPVFDQAGIHPIIVGYTATTPLATDIDLSTVAVGDLPFIAAGYRVDTMTFTTDAAFLATAGTLRLTSACATDIEGTLTNATFRGVTGGLMDPMVDPNGCMFTGITMAFHISTGPCP